MKHFHVQLHVNDLAQSIAFYSKLFAAEPARVETDDAKWMLEDPRLNFAISTCGAAAGVGHLGIQVDEAAELSDLKDRTVAANPTLLDEGQTTCCDARSDKHWITDPQGVAWEQFQTLGNVPVFNKPAPAEGAVSACRALPAAVPVPASAPCCGPAAASR